MTNARFLVSLLLALLLTGCERDAEPSPEPAETTKPPETMRKPAVAQSQSATRRELLKVIDSLAESSRSSASDLRQAVESYVRKPSPESRQSALAAWQQAHDHIMMWQWLRSLDLYDPVLDLNQLDDPVKHSIWSRLDQYPMLPGYLDAVPGYPTSGLVHMETPVTLEQLNLEHQFSDAAYVALGYHALEFLLTGGDNSGARHEDFAALPNEKLDPLRNPRLRRSLYALQLAKQIDDDTRTLIAAWSQQEGSSRQSLTNL
ncbi:MAG: imelysin family protein, partial [Oleiphilaceae bacterium]|nr:imelysin family protein [Oleiphilaceae bacterium]